VRLAVPVEKLPHGGPHNHNAAFFPQSFDHLVKRRVRRLCECAQNEIRVRIQHGSLWLALFGRTNVPGGALQPRPCSGCCNPDRKPSCRLMRRFPAFDCRYHPLTQIHAVRLAHPILPTQSRRWNQPSASKRIPSDSLFEELALAVHIIDRLAGHDLAVATAKALSIDRNPESQRPYFLFIAPKDHGDDKVLQLQSWIEIHHGEPIGIEDMVNEAGMSVRNLNRRFLNATGLSPRQYLRRVRIETAKRLLEGRNAPVDRIAEQVGYGDTRAFIRAFGVLAGLSPGQYRDKFRARRPI
jgi:AraC-like DNA-binding protein